MHHFHGHSLLLLRGSSGEKPADTAVRCKTADWEVGTRYALLQPYRLVEVSKCFLST